MGSAQEPWTVSPKDGPSSVRIYLWDTKQRENIQHRIIYLSPPSYELKIGRGSQSEQCLRPTEDNAWFTARVMSRDHAILRADAETKRITLEDTGSMHGTYINGVRLEQGKQVVVHDDTTIRFGAEIVRGELTYDPLDLQVHYVWPDVSESAPMNPRLKELLRPRNSFSVDYSEDEGEGGGEDDDEVELVYESVRVVHPELDRQSRTFSVPDSDEDISDASVAEQEDTNSAPSSPIESTTPEIKNKTAVLTAVETDHHAGSIVPGSTFQSALDVSDDEAEENLVEPAQQLEDDEYVHSEDDHESSDEDSNEDLEDEMEEQEQEEEEEAFNIMQSELCDFPRDTAQTSVNNRAPSPSDAALPKTWYTQNEVPAIPMIIPESRPGLSYQQHFTTEPPIAPPSQPFSYYNGMNWLVNGDSNGNFTSSYPQTFCMPPAQRQTSCRMTLSRPNHTDATTPSNATAAVTADLIQAKPSKVSINDIIENTPIENTPIEDTNNFAPRKRKADAISTTTPEEEVIVHSTFAADTTKIEVAVPQFGEVEADSIVEKQESATHGMQVVAPTNTETQSECPDKSLAPVPIATAVDENRSQKRIKTEHSPRGNAFLKYAATAMVGAAVGAVGTVFGLAALPAEYFT